jgi:hypothetical protein
MVGSGHDVDQGIYAFGQGQESCLLLPPILPSKSTSGIDHLRQFRPARSLLAVNPGHLPYRNGPALVDGNIFKFFP